MSNPSSGRILFVDDEPCMREVMAMVLNDAGYDTTTAEDGLDALAQLKIFTPDILISDLNMPRMSGFEFLSVVRLRFPAIPVIAVSGAYDCAGHFPGELMADAYYPKGRCNPDELLSTVAELIHAPVKRATNYRPCHPPAVQKARAARDAKGVPFQTLTCTDCLRAFPLGETEGGVGIQEALCQFCATPVRFLNDFGQTTSPQRVAAPLQALRATAG